MIGLWEVLWLIDLSDSDMFMSFRDLATNFDLLSPQILFKSENLSYNHADFQNIPPPQIDLINKENIENNICFL